jgi:hypothetical protein
VHIRKQINVSGNANVIAHEVHVHMAPHSRNRPAAPKSAALLPAVLGLLLGISTILLDSHPILVGGLAVAFLISIALVLRGETINGTDSRRLEGHLQHHSQQPGRSE